MKPMESTLYSYRDDVSVPDFADDKPVIVFDGHCVLCSRWAHFVLKHDTDKRFRLLAAQSELGEALYTHYGLKADDYETNLLVIDGGVRTKSDGTLAMFGILGAPWSVMQVFRIVPGFIRDPFYNLIARNRLKWFGQRDICFLPPPGSEDQFL